MGAPEGWCGLIRIMDRSEDQDSTDLQKCLACASRQIAASPSTLAGASIFAAGAPLNKPVHVLPASQHRSALQHCAKHWCSGVLQHGCAL